VSTRSTVTNAVPPVAPSGDLPDLWIYIDGAKTNINLRPALLPTSALKLTSQGISTVVCDVIDWDRKILRSGALSTRSDIVLKSGYIPWKDHWFRLAAVNKKDDQLQLTFEDRHVQILKQFNKKLLVSKGTLSRCQFIWRLFLEAKQRDPSMGEFISPCSIGRSAPPAVIDSVLGIKPQPPSFKYVPGASVLKKGAHITIKGVAPRDDQIKNINDILNEGMKLKARRKILVTAMMVAIGESSITNLDCVQKYGRCPDGPIGVFQQYHSDGWPASNIVTIDAHAFLDAAISVDRQYPNISYAQLGTKAQNSGVDPLGLTGQFLTYSEYISTFRLEAERIVTAWGVAGGDIQSQGVANNPGAAGSDPFTPTGAPTAVSGPDTSTIQWHRGAPVRKSAKHGSIRQWQPEDSWDCMQRMANEVQWWCYFYVDDLHFEKGDDILSRTPDWTLKEFNEGVDYINGDYDRNKVNGTVTITAETRLWQAQPGDVILLEEMGPWDGRWIMTDYERDLISGQITSTATITLKKPQPALPEPSNTGLTVSGGGPFAGGGVPPGKRSADCVAELQKVVQTAQFYTAYPGLGQGGNNGYSEARPIYTIHNQVFPPDIPPYLDCSGFAATCYAVAGWTDPGLAGEGANTTSQWRRGKQILEQNAQPGDLVFWSGPDHVAVYIGGGMCISHGGPGGPITISVAQEDRYHTNRMGFRSYCGTK